jgi:hypothetical protein
MRTEVQVAAPPALDAYDLALDEQRTVASYAEQARTTGRRSAEQDHHRRPDEKSIGAHAPHPVMSVEHLVKLRRPSAILATAFAPSASTGCSAARASSLLILDGASILCDSLD